MMRQIIKRDKAIGNNIRLARINGGLTQDQLVAKLQLSGCDISRGTLAKIEAGIRHISVDELKSLKIILNLSYDDIFDI